MMILAFIFIVLVHGQSSSSCEVVPEQTCELASEGEPCNAVLGYVVTDTKPAVVTSCAPLADDGVTPLMCSPDGASFSCVRHGPEAPRCGGCAALTEAKELFGYYCTGEVGGATSQCVPKKALGESCAKTTQCAGKDVQCFNGKCAVGKLGDRCGYAYDGTEPWCDEQQLRCTAAYTYGTGDGVTFSGTCALKLANGDACQYNRDCVSDYCKDKTCTSSVRVAAGEPCSASPTAPQCALLTTCENGACVATRRAGAEQSVCEHMFQCDNGLMCTPSLPHFGVIGNCVAYTGGATCAEYASQVCDCHVDGTLGSLYYYEANFDDYSLLSKEECREAAEQWSACVLKNNGVGQCHVRARGYDSWFAAFYACPVCRQSLDLFVCDASYRRDFRRWFGGDWPARCFVEALHSELAAIKASESALTTVVYVVVPLVALLCVAVLVVALCLIYRRRRRRPSAASANVGDGGARSLRRSSYSAGRSRGGSRPPPQASGLRESRHGASSRGSAEALHRAHGSASAANVHAAAAAALPPAPPLRPPRPQVPPPRPGQPAWQKPSQYY